MWAKVHVAASPSTGKGLNKGKYKLPRPIEEWEFTQRQIGEKQYAIYACYLGRKRRRG